MQTMQLGMVGLGRMGAKMVRRLMAAGHEGVVHDVSREPIDALAAGAPSRPTRWTSWSPTPQLTSSIPPHEACALDGGAQNTSGMATSDGTHVRRCVDGAWTTNESVPADDDARFGPS